MGDISLLKTEQKLQKLIVEVKTSIAKTYGNHVQLINEKQISERIDKSVLEIISNLKSKEGKMYDSLLESVFSSVNNILSKVSEAVKDIRQKLRICYVRFMKLIDSV